MRKMVKKIATLAASVAMVAAMGVSAFAADTYSMLGNACLFGDAETPDTWEPTNEDLFLTPVDGMDGVYSCERTFAKGPADAKEEEIEQWTQFKVVADADMMGWSYQMCLGNPEAAWADNQTQFKISQDSLKEGAFKVYVRPADGLLAVIQDGQAVDYLVRFHSRDEDSWNFVEPTVAAVKADGYDDGAVNFTDEALAAFINECVVNEGGTPVETTVEDDTEAAKDDTTVEDNTDAAKEDTTAAAKEEKEEKDSNNTMIIVIVVVVVVVIIAAIALIAGKKKN